ncbi:ATP-binding protein [Dactylosporangium sp. CA-139066]|uniref:ATP-binding protein n=1 Tax=Dactylosporangium sp. CA-139066 TaxID=3239930 RepID=UPI003D94FD91
MLWEREAALAELDGLRRAGGRIALVAGEAGIGKSSLVRAFAGAQPDRVWWGACDPLVTPRALGPLHDIGRVAGGALAAALAVQEPPARLFAALLDALERSRRAPVLVVEDLHWADAATLDVLVLLARRIDRLGALLVLTYRDDEAAGHPLTAALAAFPRDVVRRVALPRLSQACVAEQAARSGRDPAAVYALTGGNPLLVTEVLSSGDPAGGAVAGLILTRLARLEPPARDLAELAAVLQRLDVPGDGPEPALVDRCVAGGVLVAVDGGVGYKHELLRRSVEDALPPGRRRALHRRAMRRLAEAGGADPARLAHHAALSGDKTMLLRYSGMAAEAAAAQGAHREAAAHYRAILSAQAHTGAAYADLLEAFAFQAYLAGIATDALDARRRAAAERRRLGDPEREGANERWISRLAWWNGDAAQARAAAERAVDILREAPPGRELAMAHSNRAQLHMLAFEVDAAIDWGTRAAALAERLGDVETAVHAATNVETARHQRGDPADAGAAEELRRLHERAAAAGLVDHAARALVNRAAVAMWIGDDLAWTAEALEAALRYATGSDLEGYVQYLLGVRACVRVERCDWEGALCDADESLSYATHIGVAPLPAYVARGRVQSGRGDPAAEATLDRALELALGTGEVQRIGPVAIARAEHFLFNGAPERAAEEARRGLGLAVSVGHSRYTREIAYRLWLATGEPLPPGGGPFADLVAGKWAAAAEAWHRGGRPLMRVHALAAGDAAAAGEALATLESLGARSAAQWLRARLRQRGVTGVPRGPRASTAANAAGLTGRQGEVLRLLAEGLSNADIAARLTLSEKTVQHHVSAILAKLSVPSRAQAAAAARRLGLD